MWYYTVFHRYTAVKFNCFIWINRRTIPPEYRAVGKRINAALVNGMPDFAARIGCNARSCVIYWAVGIWYIAIWMCIRLLNRMEVRSVCRNIPHAIYHCTVRITASTIVICNRAVAKLYPIWIGCRLVCMLCNTIRCNIPIIMQYRAIGEDGRTFCSNCCTVCSGSRSVNMDNFIIGCSYWTVREALWAICMCCNTVLRHCTVCMRYRAFRPNYNLIISIAKNSRTVRLDSCAVR